MYYRGARAHCCKQNRIPYSAGYITAPIRQNRTTATRGPIAALFGIIVSASCRSITAKFGRIVLLRRAGPLGCIIWQINYC